jgi:ABC-2 type transport system ATP-binding protein
MKSLLAKLSTETFILDLKQSSSALQLDGFNSRLIDEHTLEVDVEKSQGLNKVFEQLTAQQIEVLSMRNKSNRLEELFITLTGNTAASANIAKGKTA